MRISIGLLMLVTACGGAQTSAAEPATESSEPAERVWTGAVSEDEFLALHELTGDEAPPSHGQLIDLQGSRAYLSLPEAEPPRSAIVVIHEWWGLNEHIQHWADRLAADGYAALAVDLYGGQVATEPPQAMELMRAVNEETALGVLRHAVRFLQEDARIQATKIASIGWCFGGGWSLKTALLVDGLSAAVMYYGQPITDPEALRGFDVPVLGVFGNEDTSIPPAKVDELEQALAAAGTPHRILRYDAPHAFANPSSARYVHVAAEAAWTEVRSFLREHL